MYGYATGGDLRMNRMAADLLTIDRNGDFESWLQNEIQRRNARSWTVPAEKIRKIFAEKEQVFRRSLPSPFVLLAIDKSGDVLHATSHPECRQTHLSRVGSAGANVLEEPGALPPVKMAAQRQNDVFLTGDEPWLGDEAGWAALTVPLRSPSGDIFGWFAFFTLPQYLSPKAFPYVQSLSLMLESEIKANRPAWVDFTDYMGQQLEQFCLTPRERQVAALWMMDYDYKQIGRAIGISENTVRVIVSRLNAKMNVNSKASLILRVLGAI